METKNKIILELKVKHFEDADFSNNRDCAIVRSYNELTGNYSSACVHELDDRSKNIQFRFSRYGSDLFEEDKEKAESHDWDDTVIRTIELIEKQRLFMCVDCWAGRGEISSFLFDTLN